MNLPFEYKSDLGRSSAFSKFVRIRDRLIGERLQTIGYVGTVESSRWQPADLMDIAIDLEAGERNLNALIL